jgi:hypothetical protein
MSAGLPPIADIARRRLARRKSARSGQNQIASNHSGRSTRRTYPSDVKLSCYFVPTATRRSVGTITPSLRSNCRMTVSISFHTASRWASLICSRNGRISGSEFRRCSIAAASVGNRWTLDTISTATSRKPTGHHTRFTWPGDPGHPRCNKTFRELVQEAIDGKDLGNLRPGNVIQLRFRSDGQLAESVQATAVAAGGCNRVDDVSAVASSHCFQRSE